MLIFFFPSLFYHWDEAVLYPRLVINIITTPWPRYCRTILWLDVWFTRFIIFHVYFARPLYTLREFLFHTSPENVSVPSTRLCCGSYTVIVIFSFSNQSYFASIIILKASAKVLFLSQGHVIKEKLCRKVGFVNFLFFI